MSKYKEAFLLERLAHGYTLLRRLVPQAKGKIILKQPSKEMLRDISTMPKANSRVSHLKSLCLTAGDKIAAVLLSRFPARKEFVAVERRNEAGVTATYGFDGRGPFKEQLEKSFFTRKKKLVRRRISFEELVLACQGGDPDTLVNNIHELIADAIRAIEEAFIIAPPRKQLGGAANERR